MARSNPPSGKVSMHRRNQDLIQEGEFEWLAQTLLLGRSPCTGVIKILYRRGSSSGSLKPSFREGLHAQA